MTYHFTALGAPLFCPLDSDDSSRFVDLWPGEVEELHSTIPGERGVLGHHADDGALGRLTLKPT